MAHPEVLYAASGLDLELSALADHDIAGEHLIQGGTDLRAAGELLHLPFKAGDPVEYILWDVRHQGTSK
ncbi:hypothetical protein GCM10010493_06080 [Streptomyces lavendulae subsp. grasserius]